MMCINLNTVLDGHGNKPNHFPAIPINCTHVGHAKHNELLVLVHVKLVAKVICVIGNGVYTSCRSCHAGMMVSRIGPLKGLPNPSLANTKTLR